ncbi:hypothetical protein AB0A63_17245 [Lentzea sp. NPDC042327]
MIVTMTGVREPRAVVTAADCADAPDVPGLPERAALSQGGAR